MLTFEVIDAGLHQNLLKKTDLIIGFFMETC